MKKYWIHADGNSLALAERGVSYVDGDPVPILHVQFGHEDNGSWVPWTEEEDYQLIDSPRQEEGEIWDTPFIGFAYIDEENNRILIYEWTWDEDEGYYEKIEWKIQEVVE